MLPDTAWTFPSLLYQPFWFSIFSPSFKCQQKKPPWRCTLHNGLVKCYFFLLWLLGLSLISFAILISSSPSLHFLFASSQSCWLYAMKSHPFKIFFLTNNTYTFTIGVRKKRSLLPYSYCSSGLLVSFFVLFISYCMSNAILQAPDDTTASLVLKTASLSESSLSSPAYNNAPYNSHKTSFLP